MAAPHYDTFRLQLGNTHSHFGHALWDTSSEGQYLPVEVGDVGFIREGKFNRVFNALYSEHHPCNQRFGVPEYHERLSPVPNHVNHGTLYPTNFCSQGVTATSGGSNFQAQVQAVEPLAPGFAEISFSCTKKQGAALSLPVIARSEDTISQDRFRKWILRHIDTWFAFTLNLGLGIEMEDIILVTGYHRTRSSSNIVFYESEANAQVSFGVQVPRIIGTTVNWQVSSQYARGSMVNHGPSGENLSENQCIFIRGFRVERTFRIFARKIRAAAEPKPDPSGNDDEPEKRVVSIPSGTDYRDPLHILLEYIASRAPHSDLVVVHDDDLERILRVGASDLTPLESLRPGEMMDYLQRSLLEIAVMSEDFWPANNKSSRPDTERPMVAMLSGQLHSSADHQPSVSLPSNLLASRTNRRKSAQDPHRFNATRRGTGAKRDTPPPVPDPKPDPRSSSDLRVSTNDHGDVESLRSLRLLSNESLGDAPRLVHPGSYSAEAFIFDAFIHDEANEDQIRILSPPSKLQSLPRRSLLPPLPLSSMEPPESLPPVPSVQSAAALPPPEHPSPRRATSLVTPPSYSSELPPPQDTILVHLLSRDRGVGSVVEGEKGTGVTIQQMYNQVSHLDWNELRKDLRKWISPPDPSVNFNIASDAHHEGTTAWCNYGKTFADWKTSSSLLWIHGKPGSGKSVLSSVIIRDIKSTSDAGSAFLAYFYFDFRDPTKQDSHALLSSLLVQLSDQSDICRYALFSLYSVHKRGLEQPTDDSLAQCLRDMLTMTRQVPIYLIMDALDECPDDSGIPSSREKVLWLVKDLVELHLPNLRLYITSRPEFDIRITLGPLATQQISLHDESGHKQDINDYVALVVRSDDRMKRWRDEDKDAIIECLTEQADGMFRWVFCQLEALRHCFPANLRHVLMEFPKSLDETYMRSLKEIKSANRKLAYRLFQCLAVAGRPLLVEELAEVLAFDFNGGGIPKLNAGWRWEDQQMAVLSACSSLVAVVVDNGSRVVQFSHFSVKEFLTSDRLANSTEEMSQFHIPIEPCHTILARACLSVLLHLDERTDKASIEKIPLLRYAAEYWYQHAAFGKVESQIQDALDRFFDMEKPHFSAWVRIQDQFELLTISESEPPSDVPLPAAPVYLAARMGFHGLVKRLILKHPQQINHSGGLYGTPLHASVLGGHIEVALLLFAHGADINSRSADNWTPLHFASQEGHLEVGKWLLNLGAEVNFQNASQCDTPLHLATSNGHLEVARLLLEHNAEVDSRNRLGSTPLLNASADGDPDVALLLLAYNADVHVCDNNGDTPLHFAATYGHLEVARLLIAHEAEVNSRNLLGSTPLLNALENRNPDVVRLLLDNGADVQLHHWIESQATCPPEQEEIAQLLSEHCGIDETYNIDLSTR